MGNKKSEVLTVRLSPELKSRVEEKAEEQNMTTTDYIRMLLREATGQGRIEDLRQNEEIIDKLEEIEQEIKTTYPGFWEWLTGR